MFVQVFEVSLLQKHSWVILYLLHTCNFASQVHLSLDISIENKTEVLVKSMIFFTVHYTCIQL